MRRWETLTALAAFICAMLGTTRFPWHGTFTVTAIVLIAVVGAARLFDALGRQARRR